MTILDNIDESGNDLSAPLMSANRAFGAAVGWLSAAESAEVLLSQWRNSTV